MAILFVFCGLQLSYALMIFYRNRKGLIKIAIYHEISNRYPLSLYILPLVCISLIALIVAYFTHYEICTLMGYLLLLPLIMTHWTIDPFCIHSVCSRKDMRNPAFRTILAKGLRSRVLTVYIIVNFILMEFSTLNCL